MKQYAKNLAKIMQGAKRGFPKYLDLSDQLHRDLVSGYFGGEEVMQEQYPLLYKAYCKAVEQGLGEISYEGFCDNALIYDSSYDCNAKKITASGRVNLTEKAKTVFVSLSILQGDTIIWQENHAFSNCKIAQLSCETDEIEKEIGDGSGYKVYLHVSWLPKSKETLCSMTAEAPEINVESGIIVDNSECISKMEVYAPTKRKNDSCSKDTINDESNHYHYDNISDSELDLDVNVNICYQRSASAVDYNFKAQDVGGLQKVLVLVHFKVSLADGWEYKQFVDVYAVLSPSLGGGDIFYLAKETEIQTEEGNLSEISVTLNEDWNNTIPESVGYGNRIYQIYIQADFMIKNENNNLQKITVTAESLKEASVKTSTDIIRIASLNFLWGCLAEGTKILMADGSEKEIQNIQKGDLIVNSKGESLRVSELITGTERYIYRVVTKGGREVSASYNHPFVTEQGDRLLLSFDYQTELQVREGDQYVYDLLSYCYPEEYNGNVYSITVEGGENTVIADGFVTYTNDAVERIERDTFVSEDAVLTSAELDEFNRLKAWIENR